MSKLVKVGAIALSLSVVAGATLAADKYGLGRAATTAEVAAWDIDIRPDGAGLPEGSGTVFQGEGIWEEKCSSCHGDFGEAVDRWPVIAGGQDTLDTQDPVKTVGSYWPYLSTVFDYVNRAMPFTEARSLEPDEVYALTAYIMSINDMVDDDFELSKSNFTSVRMPNENGFFPDDRLSTPIFEKVEPCMSNCMPKKPEVSMRARVLDVTPDVEDD